MYLPQRSEETHKKRIFGRPGSHEVFPLGLNEIKSSSTFPKLTISTLLHEFFKSHFRICFGLHMLAGELEMLFMNTINLLEEAK